MTRAYQCGTCGWFGTRERGTMNCPKCNDRRNFRRNESLEAFME